MKPLNVVVVGGGFGGLSVVRALRGASVHITLIDVTNHHVFQPLLYQVAVAALSRGNIATPLREICRAQSNVRIIMDEVISVDCDHHVVELTNERIIFDSIVLAPGSQPSYFGHPEWRQYAWSLKTLSDALRIRDRIVLAFEQADRLAPSPEVTPYLTFVIVGGGPTGVELAGAIAEIAQYSIRPDFPSLKDQKISIILVEMHTRLLDDFPEELSHYAKMSLEELGVEVQLGSQVTDISDKVVTVGTHRIESANVIWAAGNEASPLMKTLDAPLDPMGRVYVEKDLSLSWYPWVFIIGDAASCSSHNGHPLPALAAVAMQQGRYVANIITHRIPSEQREIFQYQDRGKMATLGRARAVAEIKGRKFSGLGAWLLWSVVHIFYLIGFDRVRVTIEWLWYYVTYKSSERLIEKKSYRNPFRNNVNGC
ncbi:MAG: NADH dehydrogenase [Nitrospirales bacterium]|nr:MAG: NADH dehydrogenase [Nitrospirales bacterium]